MNLSDRLEKAKRDRLALRQEERLVLGGLDEAAEPVEVDLRETPVDRRNKLAMRTAALHVEKNQGESDERPGGVAEPIRLDDYRPIDLSTFEATFEPATAREADVTLDDWTVKAYEADQLREERLRGLYELITRERNERYTIDLSDSADEIDDHDDHDDHDDGDAHDHGDQHGGATVVHLSELVLDLDAAPAAQPAEGTLPRRERPAPQTVQRDIDPRFEEYARRVARPPVDARFAAEPLDEEQPMQRSLSRPLTQPAPTMRRRGRKHANRSKIEAPREQHQCPQCGAIARIDIHDPFRGRLHLSCNVCFKMWQKEIAPTYSPPEESYLLRY